MKVLQDFNNMACFCFSKLLIEEIPNFLCLNFPYQNLQKGTYQEKAFSIEKIFTFELDTV